MNSKKNNRKIVLYGPSRNDLNHIVRVGCAKRELKVPPFYRSSVFHLDDENASATQTYSTSEKHLRYNMLEYNYSPSRKDLNHIVGVGCANRELKAPTFYRSSVFHLDGKNAFAAQNYSTSEKHLRYNFSRLSCDPFYSSSLFDLDYKI